jgi:protein TonB
MKTTFSIFVFLIIAITGFAQTTKAKKKLPPKKKESGAVVVKDHSSENFQVLEAQPVRYSGTDEQLVTYFMENLQFDSASIRANAEGQLIISFAVNPDSTVSNPVILQKFGYGIDEQAMKLILKLKFYPAQTNGIIYKSNHIVSIPIRAYIH